MLHRSFKPAKCKTALKLASSRIKLLKNKRDAQVKHLKRELAQLLESGQEQTARIRVEHVVREEKTLAAYDLLEIYCELIVARLAMIESQKNCPIDLKEAVASVIFASPRCADVPELMDVRKHFTAKYGKEFVSAAVEMRPDCGVSRLLVEKLSAKAPDGPTKIKILSAIAEEHNVKWDFKSFGEKDSKPPEDLLNGPNSFDKASKVLEDTRKAQAPPSHVNGPPNSQVSPMSNEQHNIATNLHNLNARSSPHSQTDIGANKAESSGPYHLELRPTGSGPDKMEFRHSYSGKGNDFPSGGQNWNMEFKDATAAAQAAAESAERASMAARAAAELSRRGNTNWQHQTETERHEVPQNYAGPEVQSEYHVEGPGENSSYGRHRYEETDRDRQDHSRSDGKFHSESFVGRSKSNQSPSLKSTEAFGDSNPSMGKHQISDRYSQGSSFESEQNDLSSEVSFKRQSGNSEVNFVKELHDGMDTKNVDDTEEVSIKKQSSRASSRSHSRMFNNDHKVVSNFNAETIRDDADMNPFAANKEVNNGKHHDERKGHERASVVFDDSGSDDDECKINFEGEQMKHDYGLGFSSPSRKSPAGPFMNTNSWSSRQNTDVSRGKTIPQSSFSLQEHSASVFSEVPESPAVRSQLNDFSPVTFDDSDGPSSESEEELNKSRVLRDSSFAKNEDIGSTKPLNPTSYGKPVKVHSDRNEEIRINDESVSYFGDGFIRQTSLKSTKSKDDFVDVDGFSRTSYDFTSEVDKDMGDTKSSRESNLEIGNELNFGSLTGGLRNKGYRHPPYIVSPSRDDSSSKQKMEDSTTKIEESSLASVKSPISTGATRQVLYDRKVGTEADRRQRDRANFVSSDDDSEDELLQQTSACSQQSHSEKAGTMEENKKPSSRTKIKYFDSGDSDSENDLPKQTSTSSPHVNTVFSRRTKASPKTSVQGSNLKTTFSSEASVEQDYDAERGYSLRSSYGTKTKPKPHSQEKSSSQLGSYPQQQPRMGKEAGSRPISQSKPNIPSYRGSPRSSPNAQPSNFLPRITPGRTENLNTSSSMDSPSREKARHVHPKLPDYDSLTAHLQSLRQNR